MMRGTASRCPMPYLCENGARNNAFWCASQMHACLLTDKHWPRKAIVWATPMLPHAPLRSASCLIALIRTHCIRVMFGAEIMENAAFEKLWRWDSGKRSI